MQEIVIARSSEVNKKKIAIVEEGKLQEYYEEQEECLRKEGNIYVGKVKDILPGMQAAFIDIGEDKTAFMHLKDILPKASSVTGNKEENLQKYKISDYIKPGQSILVQIKKDKSNNKGARVSSNIQIIGRFTVLIPENSFITISQKMENREERDRLKKIAQEVLVGKKVGIIVRTVAKGKSKEEIEKDIWRNIKKWEKIVKEAHKAEEQKDVPKVICEANSIVEKLLLDLVDSNLQKIIVEDENLEIEVRKMIKEVIGDTQTLIEVNSNAKNLYQLEEQIEKIQNRKIWLKCGGFITIDKTEALTAIDVNSGKYTGQKDLEKTVLRVNQEASVEIAKQLRLRDIGGIIIVDYIDMEVEESKIVVTETLREALKRDRAKTQIMEFTKLNLLEMTRKHIFSN